MNLHHPPKLLYYIHLFLFFFTHLRFEDFLQRRSIFRLDTYFFLSDGVIETLKKILYHLIVYIYHLHLDGYDILVQFNQLEDLPFLVTLI